MTFQFGVPLLLVDLFENLTGARILPRLREQAQTALTNIVQVEQYDEELVLLKANIHEDFYNSHLIMLFNTLGQYEFREQKQILPQNIEMIQYLTQGSIKRNFHKVFGAASEVFADMFYHFLSDGAPLMHINIKTFLKKFAIIWPKKKANNEDGEDEGHKK